jgi:hypothetical protein
VTRACALAFFVLILLERLTTWRMLKIDALTASPLLLVIVASYLVLAACIVGYVLLRGMRRLRGGLVALIALELALLIAQAHLYPVPRSLPHHPDGFSQLLARIDLERRPDDRLFVWGWLPELYSATGMEAASHLVNTQYIVNDYVDVPQVGLNRPMAAELMKDLNERAPRLIIDASRRSWTMVARNDPWIYDLTLYPDFEFNELLRNHYRVVGTFDRCVLYVRREREAPAG